MRRQSGFPDTDHLPQSETRHIEQEVRSAQDEETPHSRPQLLERAHALLGNQA